MHVPRIWYEWCILYDMIENAENIFPHYFQIRYSKHWDFYLILQKSLQKQSYSDADFHKFDEKLRLIDFWNEPIYEAAWHLTWTYDFVCLK